MEETKNCREWTGQISRRGRAEAGGGVGAEVGGGSSRAGEWVEDVFCESDEG